MTYALPRRRLVSSLAIGGFSALAACTITSAGGVYTATIDVQRIVTDGKAVLSMMSAAISAPAVAALLGANQALAIAALAAGQVALAEIESLGGSSVSLSLDTTQVKSLVMSLLADAQTVLALVQGTLSGLSGNLAATIGNYVAAALSLIPLVQLAAGLAGGRPMTTLMGEAQALAIAAGT